MIVKTEKVMGLDGIPRRRHIQRVRKADGSEFDRQTCWYPRDRKVMTNEQH